MSFSSALRWRNSSEAPSARMSAAGRAPPSRRPSSTHYITHSRPQVTWSLSVCGTNAFSEKCFHRGGSTLRDPELLHLWLIAVGEIHLQEVWMETKRTTQIIPKPEPGRVQNFPPLWSRLEYLKYWVDSHIVHLQWLKPSTLSSSDLFLPYFINCALFFVKPPPRLKEAIWNLIPKSLLSLSIVPPPRFCLRVKFHKYLSTSCWVILLTDRKTN